MKRIKITFFACSLLFFTAATAQTTKNNPESVKREAGTVTYSKAGMMSAQAKNRPVEMYHARGNQFQHAQIKAVLTDVNRLKKIEAVDRAIRTRKQ